MKIILGVLSLFLCLTHFSQYSISGKVIDSKTGELLPFVNIGVNNTNLGTSTDIDGGFSFKTKVNITSLQFSYVGYENKNIPITTSKKLVVKLSKKTINLKEVVINPEENPALRIIRNVIKNRDVNDVEKRDYSCNLYNKFTMNAFEDTTLDSYQPVYDKDYKFYEDSVVVENLDSTGIENKKKEEGERIAYVNSTPMFLLETYVDKKHKTPNKNKELITASKMSGFKNPMFLALATKIQSFSFYNSMFAIDDKEYLSPISKPGLRKYFYLIEDTLYDNLDTVFVISFRPYKGKVFDGMKGVLQISTNKFALKSVIAEPADTNSSMKIKIQQLYSEDSNKNWIPKQLLGRVDYGGDLIQVDELSLFTETKTYITNFDYQKIIKNREIDNLAFEIALDAHEVDSLEWSRLRTNELTEGESFTMMDSLKDSIPVNLDRMLEVAKILMTGRVPYKKVSLDLNRLLGYNDFEGFRLGAGLHTNKRFSKWFQVGGYFAYGFKDEQWKYGGDVNFKISKKRDVDVNFSYQSDVVASGKSSFFEPPSAGIVPNDYTTMFINQMDNLKKYEGYFSFGTLKHFKVTMFGNMQTRLVNNDYLCTRLVGRSVSVDEQIHFISEYGINVRFAFGETFYYDGMDRFSLGSKAPILYGKISSGVSSDYGNLSYVKYDFKVTDEFKIGRLGKSHITIQGGIVSGKVPYTLLYNPDGIFKQFNVSSNNAFETMQRNEFLSDREVNVFFGHKFKNFRIGKKFKPQLEIVSNLGFGSLGDKTVHKSIAFKTLEHGYYESGMRLHHLLKINFSTFGIGGFYRYGPNSFSQFKNNIAVKFVVGFQL
jgi:hypothetical protein